MKYVFFGTPEFAAIILEKLIKAGMPPAVVVCNPDRPIGRKKSIIAPPSKLVAQQHGIKVWQPEKLSPGGAMPTGRQGSSFGGEIGEVNFAVVAAYGKILPKEIINFPRLGMIGVHPSLLPKYRGATPIQSAILNGETDTGVTLFLLDEKVDHGPVLRKSEIRISESETYETLMKKLAELSGDLLVEILPKFIKEEIKPQAQNENEATYTKKFTVEDAFVDLDKNDPVLIERKVRALNPEPGVWTWRNGKRLKILEAELRGGRLRLKKIQEAGKKPSVSA